MLGLALLRPAHLTSRRCLPVWYPPPQGTPEARQGPLEALHNQLLWGDPDDVELGRKKHPTSSAITGRPSFGINRTVDFFRHNGIDLMARTAAPLPALLLLPFQPSPFSPRPWCCVQIPSSSNASRCTGSFSPKRHTRLRRIPRVSCADGLHAGRLRWHPQSGVLRICPPRSTSHLSWIRSACSRCDASSARGGSDPNRLVRKERCCADVLVSVSWSAGRTLGYCVHAVLCRPRASWICCRISLVSGNIPSFCCIFLCLV